MQALHRALAIAAGLVLTHSAHAGISYKLEQARALPGESIVISGVLFNDTPDAMQWDAPETLVLQWRDNDGRVMRSLAQLDGTPDALNVPVNGFAKLQWRAIVPTGVTGLQAINIEGESALLALDTRPMQEGPVTAVAAAVPVVDAGAAGAGETRDPPLPEAVVASAGADATAGPPVVETATVAPAPSAFDRFRSHISAHEPVYFDLGAKGGSNARYQVSLKYRLFTPPDPAKPRFVDGLYIGYTQTALWDLESESRPFVDTSFKPSVFWRRDALWSGSDQQYYVGLQTGVEHESNGKSDEDSRSLNFAYVQPEFNYRFSGGSKLTFAPRVKAYFGGMGNNPDYTDYAGYVDWKLRWAQDHGLVLTGLYRNGKGSRDMVQLEAAWPLQRTFLNMNGYLHVQYLEGYGETLLGYNERSSGQVRVGLALIP